MNHDFAHCLDYDADICPKKCFRGALVRDLDGYLLPVTWTAFKGTEECRLRGDTKA